MKKRSVRCYKGYANVYPNVYNYLVYFPSREGWSGLSFVSCMNCSEIFVIDWENPVTNGMSINEIAGKSCCPLCGLLLKDTLRNYPQNIKLPNGKIGCANASEFTTTDEDSIILDFFEIIP